MFSTPRGFQNNSTISAKSGSEQYFLLGKIVTDLKGQKEGRKRKTGIKGGRQVVDSIGGRDTLETKDRRGRITEGEKQKARDTEERGGRVVTKEREYIATYVNTYQLISSKFLSSLKHSPKVDCGRQKTNKLGTLGKDLSCNKLRHIQSLHQREGNEYFDPFMKTKKKYKRVKTHHYKLKSVSITSNYILIMQNP